MKRRTVFLSALLLSCLAVLTGRAAPGTSKVPILGWHSIPENELSLKRFQELAEMGLTHSLMHYSPAANAKALEFARQTGVHWVKQVTWDHKVGGVTFAGVANGTVNLNLAPGAGAFLRLG